MSVMRHTLTVIAPDRLDSLPVQIHEEVELPCTPEVLFASFADAEDWPKWLGIDVEWHDEPPFADGTSRTIQGGPLRALEVFTHYEHGRRMAFYFAKTNNPMLAAFAEDWSVEPVGDDRCRLTWRAGIELKGVFGLLGPLVSWGFARNARGAFPKLDALVADR